MVRVARHPPPIDGSYDWSTQIVSWYRLWVVFWLKKRRSRMGTIDRRNQITRRGFLELSSAALATAGLLGDANAGNATPVAGNAVDTAKPDSAPITGKIALEEHFVLPETADTSYAIRDLRMPELRQ